MTQDTQETQEDPFEGTEPVAGLEHLGRAILDKNGQVSGSPANYEATRGKLSYPLPTAEDAAAAIARINETFGSDSLSAPRTDDGSRRGDTSDSHQEAP